jgi:membrane protease subunit HflC
VSALALLAQHRLAAAALIGALLLALTAVVEVPETQQAVVMRMGDPVRVINRFRPGVDYGATGAGLRCASRCSKRWCGSTGACSRWK